MQTLKIYPLPLILFGTDFWQGLVDWLKSGPLKQGLISPEDLNIITLTDDIDEVIREICAHRQWKEQQIILAQNGLNTGP